MKNQKVNRHLTKWLNLFLNFLQKSIIFVFTFYVVIKRTLHLHKIIIHWKKKFNYDIFFNEPNTTFCANQLYTYTSKIVQLICIVSNTNNVKRYVCPTPIFWIFCFYPYIFSEINLLPLLYFYFTNNFKLIWVTSQLYWAIKMHIKIILQSNCFIHKSYTNLIHET